MSDITLYHTPSSYYSMLARYALNLAEVDYQSHLVDIHFAKDHLSKEYISMNPNMTVPTLLVNEGVLIDSREILDYAVRFSQGHLKDTNTEISAIVDAHYMISIEQLTFGHVMLKHPLLKLILPKFLGKICHRLEQSIKEDALHQMAYVKKLELNRSRIRYFTEGSLAEKHGLIQATIKRFLESLPAVEGGSWMVGDKPSLADVVMAVFLARLKMAGEGSLVDHRPDLVVWFEGLSQTEAFKRSDIWTQFSPLRLFKSARKTS
jgi:glutathione S-transferase